MIFYVFNMIQKTYTAFLFLENGMLCQGWSFLSSLNSIGEVVFNTGMTGYQEIITDPSYCDQIVLLTYPEIGNTGVNSVDVESDRLCIKGLIVKNFCLNASNWRSQVSLVNYLVDYNIPHIFGVDTRYLVKFLRNKGVMTACIATDKIPFSSLRLQFRNFKALPDLLASRVSTQKLYKWSPKSIAINYLTRSRLIPKVASLNVVVLDYGIKVNILNRLIVHGCTVTVMPADTDCKSILDKCPDGVLLSNGPGDPSLIIYAIDTIKKLIRSNVPIFGICLGHQLLSLALGAQTYKLKFGHRGLNHPSGRCNVVSMTSQNHGYVVSTDSMFRHSLDAVFVNLNDNTVSGIVHRCKPCFSVQYHPEASPGPHDSDYLFSHFVQVMFLCKSGSM